MYLECNHNTVIESVFIDVKISTLVYYRVKACDLANVHCRHIVTISNKVPGVIFYFVGYGFYNLYFMCKYLFNSIHYSTGMKLLEIR